MVYFRERMEAERSGEGPDRINPKLGYGGLTDIEFLTQYLQWRHGLQTPEVRMTDTQEVLKALLSIGVLAEDQALILRESHQFLTSLDHALQLMLDRREEPRTYTKEDIIRLERLNLMGLGRPPYRPGSFGSITGGSPEIYASFSIIFSVERTKRVDQAGRVSYDDTAYTKRFIRQGGNAYALSDTGRSAADCP